MNIDNSFIDHHSRNEKKKIHNRDIIYALVKKWWVILIFALVMGVGAYCYTIVSYVPLFTANSSMVINTEQANDINMVDTYTPILVSDNVLQRVATEIKRDIPPDVMRDYIKITSPKASEVIMVEVSNLDPQVAVDIANAMIKVAPVVIAETAPNFAVSALDYAKLPKIANPPQYIKNVAIGTLLGLVIGVFIVIGLWILFPKIRSEKEINENLQLSVLGEIPKNRNSEGKIKTQLITDPGVGVLFVEAFKLLGLHLEKISSEKNYKTFLMASALEDDGKTTVSINLALTLASAGASVLFIEGDVHKSDIFKDLGDEFTVKHTFSDYKKSGVAQKDCIAKYQGFDLYVLPLKSDDYGSGNSFNENEISQMIHLLKNEFDYLIIDSPPAFILSDAAIMSKYVDGVIFIVKQEQSSPDVLIKTKNTLEGAGANIVGCVLNDVRDSRMDYKNLLKSGYTNANKSGMMNKQRTYTSAEKVKVVLEVLKEEESLSQIASRYGIQPNQITLWKEEFLQNANKAFEIDKT